jgi:hypothetical protein
VIVPVATTPFTKASYGYFPEFGFFEVTSFLYCRLCTFTFYHLNPPKLTDSGFSLCSQVPYGQNPTISFDTQPRLLTRLAFSGSIAALNIGRDIAFQITSYKQDQLSSARQILA